MGGIQEDILKIQQHYYKRIHSNLLTLECIAWDCISEIFWFRIPMWVTEFDWNGDLDEPDVPWDYEEYARILDDFYTLMFSQEVTQLLVFIVKIFIKVSSIKGIFGIVAWKRTTFDFVSKTPNVAGEAYLRLYNDQWRTTGDMRIL